ncbi:FAD-binding domain-containing protein [Natranaeroarchaeum sulfidigenes]|uniref:Deoxyribodipyrimidine photolyase n=1 Tax=Natranaeroarchaeum sulfidigenes TaxID=2784880 RepID=A0A897MT13_9EURY|nr:FAD-binding domain-containing protein [Natranaeroarchaeum sulfidigenes]QSG01346.1 Deoxyribodipyrimidine photolyase [Natranaeroarchaeum sulfidigenes]
MGDRIAVWHRDDLRLRDSPALVRAAADGQPVPVFVFDPTFYDGIACDSRIRFLHESIDALGEGYREHGGQLATVHGDPATVLPALDVDRVYVNRSVTGRYGHERDRRLFEREEVTPIADDGIDWSKRPRSAYDWQAQAEAYFEREPLAIPETDFGTVDAAVTTDEIERRYGVEPSKRGVPTGGWRAAHERLEAFTERLDEYIGGISPPAAAEERTSHLSPYLALGCLSPREAYSYVTEHGREGRGRELFVERLFWNRHFSQKLADWPAATDRAINPVFRGLFRSRHDPDLVDAWKEGRTGFPLVDASMRALEATGWLNFRMRAMCATFYTYILQCWWKIGADWFYRHLIDADAAINYQQWQMQSGLVGVHPLRIYNPRKQVRENDPDGEFIRKYVPELADLPAEHLDRPEKTPLSVQRECDVRIGEDYPHPVVEFERRREETRAILAELVDRAEEALEDPEIRRRASLSGRRSRAAGDVDEGDRPSAESQSELSEF